VFLAVGIYSGDVIIFELPPMKGEQGSGEKWIHETGL
jgi:hypothetical protein